MTFDELKEKVAKLMDEYETSHGNLTIVECVLHDTDAEPDCYYSWNGDRMAKCDNPYKPEGDTHA